ncbi:hypothetical protein IGS73_06170 [Janibacter indicus]|uniref:Ig-like domain-containing protein n=1 Tax=Janibacter indicus TaxID=857417 RepID=A0A7L9J320_9MICO|nr:hypothetical protein [Janibacter indicus]QOK23958.1 hypothetical protein IGS73_06170 [Janibacter indicus]
MYRTAITSGAAALLLVVSACGSGADSEDTPSVTETSRVSTTEGGESETSSTQAPSSSSSVPSSTPSSSTTASESETSGGDAAAPATQVVNVWVDDSWKVEEVDEDVCGGSAYQSQFSTQDDVYTCGATASSALACLDDEGGDTATCIANGQDRIAIHFPHEPIDPSEVTEREAEAIPLYVELADGTMCGVLAHDQAQHWDGMFSWYGCSDASELLTEEHIADTFDDAEESWTVQRSTGKGKPVETPVAKAVFAGK